MEINEIYWNNVKIFIEALAQGEYKRLKEDLMPTGTRVNSLNFNIKNINKKLKTN